MKKIEKKNAPMSFFLEKKFFIKKNRTFIFSADL